MKMHDLPVRAALRDNKRNTSIAAGGLAIAHACDVIHTSDNDRSVRQNNRRVADKCGASWSVAQERTFKILADIVRLDYDRLAAGSQEVSVRSIERNNAIDVGVRECFSSFSQNLKRVLLWASDNV